MAGQKGETHENKSQSDDVRKNNIIAAKGESPLQKSSVLPNNFAVRVRVRLCSAIPGRRKKVEVLCTAEPVSPVLRTLDALCGYSWRTERFLRPRGTVMQHTAREV